MGQWHARIIMNEYTTEEIERFYEFMCRYPRDTENLLQMVSMMAA